MNKKLDDDNALGMGRLSSDEKKNFQPKIMRLHKRQNDYKKRVKPIAKKLSNHSSLYSIGKSIYRIYCDLTGSLHLSPDFIIIGAARCGTTTLYEGITEHPNVFHADIKEILFFEDQYNRGVGWYRGHFPYIWKKYSNFLKRNLTGEASPRYFLSPRAPMRIAKLLPNVKLIIILRNPVDRTYSHYQLRVGQGDENLSFEDVIDNAITEGEVKVKNAFELMRKDSKYYNSDYFSNAYLTHSRYVENIEFWLKYFPQDQLLVLNSEEFDESPNKTFGKVFDFLNLPNYTNSKYVKYNTRKYSEMKSSTREKLIDYFKPYNERLYKLIGKEFSWDK